MRTTVVSPVIISVVHSVKFSVAVFRSVVHKVPGDSVVSVTRFVNQNFLVCFHTDDSSVTFSEESVERLENNRIIVRFKSDFLRLLRNAEVREDLLTVCVVQLLVLVHKSLDVSPEKF